MAKRIVVNLWREVVVAFDGDTPIYTFDCVSGDQNHQTEEAEENIAGIGTVGLISGDVVKHKIIRKERWCYSHKYEAQMNYAMFFTSDGKAIHQGTAVGLLSYLKYMDIGNVGSHGCVRLSEDHAAQLYTWAPIGTRVIVVGHSCNHSPSSSDVEAARTEAGVPSL